MNNSPFSFDVNFGNEGITLESCSTDNKSCCCPSDEEIIDTKAHWNNIYTTIKTESLEWYEDKAEESISLIEKCGLSRDALIMNIGAGTTTLINELSDSGFNNIYATDISDVALDKLKKSINCKDGVTIIEDDIVNSKEIKNINNIDLWHDRAVLHFFTKEEDIKSYFNLLNTVVKVGGYAILAPFNKLGTDQCSGFTVRQYDEEMLKIGLGNNFKLIHSFNHEYTSPIGNKKNFIYSLFKKL